MRPASGVVVTDLDLCTEGYDVKAVGQMKAGEEGGQLVFGSLSQW